MVLLQKKPEEPAERTQHKQFLFSSVKMISVVVFSFIFICCEREKLVLRKSYLIPDVPDGMLLTFFPVSTI